VFPVRYGLDLYVYILFRRNKENISVILNYRLGGNRLSFDIRQFGSVMTTTRYLVKKADVFSV
jgi:hypothetical protein